MQNQWIVLVLAALSIIFFCITYISLGKAQELVRAGATTDGTVIKMIYSSHDTNSGVYYPVVRFQTTDGQTLEERSRFGSSPPEFKQGDHVQILYTRDNPKNWCINSWWDLYFVPTIFGVFTGILGITTIIVQYCITHPAPKPLVSD